MERADFERFSKGNFFPTAYAESTGKGTEKFVAWSGGFSKFLTGVNP